MGACTPLFHHWNVRIKGFPALSRRPQTTRCSPRHGGGPRRGRVARKTAKVTRPKRGAGKEPMATCGTPWRAAYHQTANSILYLLVFANIAGAQPLGDVWSQKHKSCVLLRSRWCYSAPPIGVILCHKCSFFAIKHRYVCTLIYYAFWGFMGGWKPCFHMVFIPWAKIRT